MYLTGKTAIITGSSRGIGRAIALRLARAGANIVVAAKTERAHPKLPGTILSVAQEIRELGVEALPLKVDVRDEAAISAMVEQAVVTFGRVDILVNNAGAINLRTTEQIDVNRIDLMYSINQRAPLICAQHCIPHMRKAGRGHILNMSPPIDLNPKWFKNYTAYTISKFAMTMATIGLASEVGKSNIAVNSLWPKTTIATAAIEFNPGMPPLESCRTPEIVADAAHEIIDTEPRQLNGQALLDEDILRERGISDFTGYAVDPDTPPMPDLYIG